MRTISVAIPSKGRPKVKTLRFCPWATLYVAPDEEEAYRKQNQTATIHACEKGVQGNIARVRNYILRTEFARGASAVCMMDDDIASMFCWQATPDRYGYEKNRLSGDTFAAFLEKYTSFAEELGCTLWGVNCIPSNRAYRHGSPFSLENIVLGPFSVHLSNRFTYDEEMPLKEDYDMFLQHVEAERRVLRLNFAGYENGASDGKPGGCSFQRNVGQEKRQFEMLRRKWGGGTVVEDRHKVQAFDFNPIIHNPIAGA